MSAIVAIGVARVGDEHWRPIPGSCVDACFYCKFPVNVAPASLGLLRRDARAVLACLECLSEIARRKPIPLATTKAHEVELLKYRLSVAGRN